MEGQIGEENGGRIEEEEKANVKFTLEYLEVAGQRRGKHKKVMYDGRCWGEIYIKGEER